MTGGAFLKYPVKHWPQSILIDVMGGENKLKKCNMYIPFHSESHVCKAVKRLKRHV